MPTQTEAGKAFEFSLLNELFENLTGVQQIDIIKDNSYDIAKNCYHKFSEEEQLKYNKAAISAVYHLLKLEPRLENPLSENDKLELKIVPDSVGICGDVRDVLAIRSIHNWEIGISAKNQHKAIKHSRLSDKIDFGKKWLDIPSSKEYFDVVKEVFQKLRSLKSEKVLWRDIKNKDHDFYIPVLDAFKKELLKIDRNNPAKVPQRLLHYLI